MYHLAGFSESLDPAGAFVNIAGLQDDALFVQGDDMRVPELDRIIFAFGGADAVAAPRIRLTSPRLVRNARLEVAPLNSQNAAAVEPDSPAKVADYRNNPIQLAADEILRAELNSNPAAAQIQWCFLGFGDGPVQKVASQEAFTVRGTGATTVTANAWSPVQVTLDDELPEGNYDIIGMRAEGATMVAARVINRAPTFWRPGCIASDTVVDIGHEMFRDGNLGVWGTFPFTQFPDIDVLAMAADTAQIFHFDLVRR